MATKKSADYFVLLLTSIKCPLRARHSGSLWGMKLAPAFQKGTEKPGCRIELVVEGGVQGGLGTLEKNE